MMVMPVMKGGGAERVAALLMNEFHRCGYDVKFLLTSSASEEVINRDLDEHIPLILLQEQLSDKKDYKMKATRIYSSLFSKIFEGFKKPVPAHFAYWSFVSQYKEEIEGLRSIMEQNPDMAVIAFLQPSIPMVLLAAKGLPNRIIISERGNPERLMKNRYGKPFIEKYYKRADRVVFQTEEAKKTYPKEIAEKGVVILNPIKSDLPEPYHGERNKTITTFCRISKQKNLPLLIEAFALFHKGFPDYSLKIIGDAINEEGIAVQQALKNEIQQLGLEDYVKIYPFRADVHKDVIRDAIYVNSSDYEGISNAMLEAMAIGMPVVCTDCPIGGAHAAIEDGVNGMLVPVQDAEAMYTAMRSIIEDDEFASKLSRNAADIRNTLSLENIASQWMELL